MGSAALQLRRNRRHRRRRFWMRVRPSMRRLLESAVFFADCALVHWQQLLQRWSIHVASPGPTWLDPRLYLHVVPLHRYGIGCRTCVYVLRRNSEYLESRTQSRHIGFRYPPPDFGRLGVLAPLRKRQDFTVELEPHRQRNLGRMGLGRSGALVQWPSIWR